MLLYELEQVDPLVIKMVTVTDQLKSTIQDHPNMQWTVDDLLKYFQKNDLTLDKSMLYDMIKKPPLKNVIANIQGDNIVFKGQEQPEQSDDENKKIVAQMANKAQKLK